MRGRRRTPAGRSRPPTGPRIPAGNTRTGRRQRSWSPRRRRSGWPTGAGRARSGSGRGGPGMTPVRARPNHGRMCSGPSRCAASAAPGLQKHPVRSEMPARFASCSTRRSSIRRPLRSWSEKVTVPPRSTVPPGPWICTSRRPPWWRRPARASSSQPVRQPARRWIASRPTRSMCCEPGRHGGQIEVVDRPVLERRLVAAQVVAVARHRGDRDRAAREPRPRQDADPVPAHQQAPDAGREAHDLVERERREVRPDLGHVEAVGGREGRRVDQHVPPRGMSLLNQVQAMLHAGEVGLCREGQQVAGAGLRGLQDTAHRRSVESQLRRRSPERRRPRRPGAGRTPGCR